MTEKELRDSLQTHLAPADLPDHQKQALLVAIRKEAAPAPEKGDTNMFRPSKFRTALVAALIVTLLSATIAVAAGFSGYVNFKGESVDHSGRPIPTPLPPALQPSEDEFIADQRDMIALAMEIIDASPRDQLTYVSFDHNGGNSSSTSTPMVHVDTLEELFALFPAELPMPKIPEGFTVNGGSAYLLCDSDSFYEKLGEETTEEGLTIQRWRIPEGEEKAEHLHFVLGDENERDISVSINLQRNTNHFFGVDGAESVTNPDIPGMDDTLLIIWPDRVDLTMRCALEKPVVLQGTHTLFGAHGESTNSYPYVTISLYSRTVPADVLLPIYQ